MRENNSLSRHKVVNRNRHKDDFILALVNKEVKIMIINMSKILVEKIDNVHEQKGKFK